MSRDGRILLPDVHGPRDDFGNDDEGRTRLENRGRIYGPPPGWPQGVELDKAQAVYDTASAMLVNLVDHVNMPA